jgi:glycosyltransferase involved in cell wall biosynthesis
MKKKRILIISNEAWRGESNGGNVLSNMFESFTSEFEFAQIYTNPSMPKNNICENYFHLSEANVISAVLRNKSIGRKLTRNQILNQSKIVESDSSKKTLTILKKINLPVFHIIQNMLWKLVKWKTPELEKFILDFNPDVVFAPMYYNVFMHSIDRYVSILTQKKLISYVSDDHLTWQQFSLLPIFWFNRWILRKNVIKTAKYYLVLYTMTDEQLQEYQEILKVKMKILKKTGNFESKPIFITEVKKPIILTYGGNLIYNRYKTLHKLVQAINNVNSNGVQMQLQIATQTPITKKLKQLLHDGKNSVLLGKLTDIELKEQYAKSDIVLHVESFDLKQRLLTRLSFSTKIIDLFSTAKCILAICCNKSSPYKYFKKEDAALLVDSISAIEERLNEILENKELLLEYSEKSWECGKRNHNVTEVAGNLKQDFLKYANSQFRN